MREAKQMVYGQLKLSESPFYRVLPQCSWVIEQISWVQLAERERQKQRDLSVYQVVIVPLCVTM